MILTVATLVLSAGAAVLAFQTRRYRIRAEAAADRARAAADRAEAAVARAQRAFDALKELVS